MSRQITATITLNELEEKSLRKLLAFVHGAHTIDTDVRKGGKNTRFESDWLKRMVIRDE